MPTTVTVDVYRRNIASQFLRGGQGYRWLDNVRLSMHRACVNAAPGRTGELKAAHRSRIFGYNQYRARAVVSNIAPHSEWVHEGTIDKAPILPKRGNYLKVPVARGSTRTRPRPSVAGQAPNPWLDDACARVAMRRGAVRIG